MDFQIGFSRIDFVILFAYFGLLLFNGIWHGRKTKKSDDFILGGKSFGTLTTLATQGATMKGGGALLGYSGGAFQSGLGVLFATTTYNIGAWVAVIVGIARKLKKCSSSVNIRSSGDILYARFPSMSLKRLGGLGAAWLTLGTLNGQMAAIALLLNLAFGRYGLSFGAALVIGATICTIYTIYGGLMSVAYNDLLQWFIMTPMIFLVLPYMLIRAGATPTAIHEGLDAAKYFTLKPSIWWLGFLISGILSAMSDLNHLTRYISAKDEKVAVRGSMFGFGYTTLFAGVVIVFGLSAALFLTPDQVPTRDATMFVLSAKVLPAGIFGLFMAAVLATVVSTMDSNLQTTVQSVMVDLVEPILSPSTSEKTKLFFYRICTAFVAAISIYMVLQLKSIVHLFSLGFTIYSSSMFFPLMSTMFWKKATKQGVLTGILVGAVTSIVALKMSLPLPVVWGVAASSIAGVVVCFLTLGKEGETPLLPGFNEIGLPIDRKIFWGCLMGLAGTLIFSVGHASWINWPLIAVGSILMVLCVMVVDKAFKDYPIEGLKS